MRQLSCLAFAVLCGSGLLLLAAPIPYKGPAPCTLATGIDSPVDKACRENGINGAKAKMKEMVKEGRTAGVKYDCDDCHISEDDYSQLVPGAEEKFQKLLAAFDKKKPRAARYTAVTPS